MKKTGAVILIGVIIVVGVAILPSFSQGTGNLAVDANGAELRLRGGLFAGVTVQSGSQPSKIPAKVYTPTRLRLTRKANGDTWRIDSQGPWGKLARIKVQEDQTTTVKLGPPLLLRPRVTVGGGLVQVEYSIFGQAGERYVNRVTRNNGLAAAPRVQIVDPNGKVLAAGQFAYG